MEPSCLPLGAHSVWQPRPNRCHHHAPLCSRASERAPCHSLHPGVGGDRVRFPRLPLVPQSHNSRGGKVPGVPAAHLRALLCLLHVQRHLPAFHVPIPARVHQNFLHRPGPERSLPVRGGFSAGRGQAGVQERHWHGHARVSEGEIPSAELLLVPVRHAVHLRSEFLGSDAQAHGANRGCDPAEVRGGSGRQAQGGNAPLAERRHGAGVCGAGGCGGAAAAGAGLLDADQRLPAGAARRLQRAHQRRAAVRAELLLLAVRHRGLPPVGGPRQHREPPGLLPGHVPVAEVLRWTGRPVCGRRSLCCLPHGAGGAQSLPSTAGTFRRCAIGGHLLDFLHRRVLLLKGGHQHAAARGRSQSPAVVRHLHPGGLAHRRAHHVPAGQRLPRVHPGSGLQEQLPQLVVTPRPLGLFTRFKGTTLSSLCPRVHAAAVVVVVCEELHVIQCSRQRVSLAK